LREGDVEASYELLLSIWGMLFTIVIFYCIFEEKERILEMARKERDGWECGL
jgi:Na+/melibiose symporter-like transporter